MRIRLRDVCVLLCLASGPWAAEAQDQGGALPAEGSRIRLTASSLRSGWHEGRLVGSDTGALKLDTGERGGVITVPRADIQRVEASLRPSRRGSGARKGAIFGALVVGILGYAAGDDCSSGEWLCFSHEAMATAGVIVGLPLGALVGLAASPGERWEPIAVGGVQLGLHPTVGRGRAGAGVSIGF